MRAGGAGLGGAVGLDVTAALIGEHSRILDLAGKLTINQRIVVRLRIRTMAKSESFDLS